MEWRFRRSLQMDDLSLLRIIRLRTRCWPQKKRGGDRFNLNEVGDLGITKQWRRKRHCRHWRDWHRVYSKVKWMGCRVAICWKDSRSKHWQSYWGNKRTGNIEGIEGEKDMVMMEGDVITDHEIQVIWTTIDLERG